MGFGFWSFSFGSKHWLIRVRSMAADARALVRLQVDHVNRALVPAFYRYLQAQEEGELYQAVAERRRFQENVELS